MIDTKLGTGAEATPGQHITVHYTGWLFDGAAPETRAANLIVLATGLSLFHSCLVPAM